MNHNLKCQRKGRWKWEQRKMPEEETQRALAIETRRIQLNQPCSSWKLKILRTEGREQPRETSKQQMRYQDAVFPFDYLLFYKHTTKTEDLQDKSQAVMPGFCHLSPAAFSSVVVEKTFEVVVEAEAEFLFLYSSSSSSTVGAGAGENRDEERRLRKWSRTA